MRVLTAAVLFFAFLFVPFSFAEAPRQPDYAKAEILSVVDQKVKVKVKSGKFQGKIISISHSSNGEGIMGGEMKVVPGDRVILYVEEYPTAAESPDGSPMFYIADYVRDTPLYWLAFFYVLSLVVVGGRKGVRALVSLVITIALIFFILFPLTLLGWNPLLVAVLVSALVSLIVFRIIGRKTIKSVSAAIGTVSGVAIAGLIAYVVGNLIHLSGLSSEEARILLYSMDLKIDFRGLLFAGILIGALGAVMDVGMSIASAIDEVRKVHPEANFKNLFDAGMNVGRDVMGTMSNTLILAYTGSALPLLLLILANDLSLAKVMNMELIAEELTRALAGSIGLILCIPITAFVSAILYEWYNNNSSKSIKL
ncbi:hypothetical protein A2276_03515 [candidate division WOR-1 bacterium RIFOXYA12_FULL_43_27]|uniref:YibE/F family protein n=1 Tax=candidate division WOR-1 bacterium RIFOXYC2_FULL_46_14 TaxID=1802587 RepID=A0A1F4U957_UNCSA|nr:MAG: hypothetical protein A2276_03515 [candidate division WOR-1 bacterium RIFOXYA12_FULL_43_27]OGC19233.1 MAG: hypothetical protein A2292_00820 [candidate division WOR-1 bacterium RIFOXYB2_FULL_46_45]OGC30222.1 MAG: hypothetical protein A2232_00820 [candidate division WOR-1 bacterium RIFOXYA2_FULL_46_56]OGC40823.1 MAG: hypothetical protein A2438_00820 [candidate division WOR-1 bacterium RIFOXYC2_FULL_46_14]